MPRETIAPAVALNPATGPLPLAPLPFTTLGVDRFGPVLRIRLRSGIDWLHAYVDNETYAFTILGGWGTWSYRWTADGQTFETFLLNRTQPYSMYYVAQKLYLESPQESFEWDEERTRSEIRQRLAAAHAACDDERRGLSAVRIANRERYHREAVEFVNSASWDELYADAAGDLEQYGVNVTSDDHYTRDSYAYRRMCEQILPAIAAAWATFVAAEGK